MAKCCIITLLILGLVCQSFGEVPLTNEEIRIALKTKTILNWTAEEFNQIASRYPDIVFRLLTNAVKLEEMKDYQFNWYFRYVGQTRNMEEIETNYLATNFNKRMEKIATISIAGIVLIALILAMK